MITLLAIVAQGVAAQRVVPSRPLDVPTRSREWAQVILRPDALLSPKVTRYAPGGIIVRILAIHQDTLVVEVFDSPGTAPMAVVDTVPIAVPTISTFEIQEYNTMVARRDTALESAFYASIVGALVGAVRRVAGSDASVGKAALAGGVLGAVYGALLPERSYGYRGFYVTFSIQQD